MFKVTLLYETDVNGIYMQEIDTANDLFNAEWKRDRMMKKWLGYVANELLYSPSEKYQMVLPRGDLNHKFQDELIQLFIKYLNLRGKEDRDRTFSIVIEEF